LFVGLLQAGSLQSFTDLFYLHRRELSPGEAPEALSVLSGIAASLAEGEAARASGDTSKLLTSLQAIGARYSASGTHGSAIMFYARALDLARSSSDTAAELHCLGELGRCEEHRGGLPAACAHHEARRALAAARGNAEALASAAADLMGVRKREAEAAEARSDLQGSLSALELALAAAKQAGNAEGEAHLSYSVGRALILSGDAQGALPHLTNFVRTGVWLPPTAARWHWGPACAHPSHDQPHTAHFPALPLPHCPHTPCSTRWCLPLLPCNCSKRGPWPPCQLPTTWWAMPLRQWPAWRSW
jgi:hypothetical protein